MFQAPDIKTLNDLKNKRINSLSGNVSIRLTSEYGAPFLPEKMQLDFELSTQKERPFTTTLRKFWERKIDLINLCSKFKHKTLEAWVQEDPSGLVLSEVKGSVSLDVNPATVISAGLRVTPKWTPRGATKPFKVKLPFNESVTIDIESIALVLVSVYVSDDGTDEEGKMHSLADNVKVFNLSERVFDDKNIVDSYVKPELGLPDKR